jgi:aminoglycoside 2''-phosphotransferase
MLIHRDLASYHILHDPPSGRLAGVIDFGTAGAGDPASDWACLINTYGESFVRRMHAIYPFDQATLDRARFLAGVLEMEWALIGVQDKDPSMLLVHLGRARDSLPPLTPWNQTAHGL